jgi:hypothetical protein
MHNLFLSVSAITLLATGMAFSVQAIRSPAAAPPPAAVTAEVAANAQQAPSSAASEEQPQSLSFVRVKTIRVEPPPPPSTPPIMVELQQQDTLAPTTTLSDQSVAVPPSPPTHTVRAAPQAHAARLVTVKRTSRAKRKVRVVAADVDASAGRVQAAIEPGPESLNPLGKLLSGSR